MAAVTAATAALACAAGGAGCGLDVQLPDLFLLTRTGPGQTLRLLVNEGGQIRCNGGRQKMLSSGMLIQARDLADSLSGDATHRLTIPRAPNSVYYFRIKLQPGTVSFPDTAAAGRKALAQAELFATQAAQRVCGLAG